MFLAIKLRAAASRGELDRIEIDPELLARKDEFEAMQARMPEDMARVPPARSCASWPASGCS